MSLLYHVVSFWAGARKDHMARDQSQQSKMIKIDFDIDVNIPTRERGYLGLLGNFVINQTPM